jgi:hypothetical protein
MNGAKPETALVRSIVQVLTTCGFWVIRLNVTGRRGERTSATGEPGLPDLYLPSLGHIEVKRPGQNLSPAQVAWHAKAAKHGLRVRVVSSPEDAVQTAMAWRADRRG